MRQKNRFLFSRIISRYSPLVLLLLTSYVHAAGSGRSEEIARYNARIQQQEHDLAVLRAQHAEVVAQSAANEAQRNQFRRDEELRERRIAREAAIGRAYHDQAHSMSWSTERCRNNSDAAVATVEEAQGRVLWARRCLGLRMNNQSITTEERGILQILLTANGGALSANNGAARGLYPTFGHVEYVDDPANPGSIQLNFTYPAHDPWPTVENASCDSW